MTTDFKPKLFMRMTCPYCIKVHLALKKADLLDEVELILCDDNGAEELNRFRAQLAEATGKPAIFPTAEISPGQYMSDSSALIAYFYERFRK